MQIQVINDDGDVINAMPLNRAYPIVSEMRECIDCGDKIDPDQRNAFCDDCRRESNRQPVPLYSMALAEDATLYVSDTGIKFVFLR